MRAVYLWRGRRFLTIGGLHNALRRAYGVSSITCGENVVVATLNSGAKYHFQRSFDSLGNSVVADEPNESTRRT